MSKKGYYYLRPNYSRWERQPLWTPIEAGLLIRGIEPSLLDTELLDRLFWNFKIEELINDKTKEDKLITAISRGDEKVISGLDMHMANWGLWDLLKTPVQSLRYSFCAGDYDHDDRVIDCLFPPDVVAQYAYDMPNIKIHDFYQNYLEKSGFGFRYSKMSPIFHGFNYISKIDIWNQGVAVKALLQAYPIGEDKKDYNFEDYTIIDNAIYASIKAKTLIPLNPNYENIWESENEITEYEFLAKDFVNWAIDKGFTPHHQLLEMMKINVSFPPNVVVTFNDIGNFYTTPYLELMKRAIIELNINESNQLKKSDVVKWFEAELPKIEGEIGSNNKAEMMATLVRLPESAKGGNRKVSKRIEPLNP